MASEIAEARGVSRPNVSALVAQLMAKGFVRQKEEPTDRRRKRLFMTAKGRVALRRLEAGRRRANRALLADLAPDDRAALLQALRACLARAWRPSTRGFGVGPGEVT
jgi:DNA-binding MarR family transcriptional regulator